LSVWSDQLDTLLADAAVGVDAVYVPKGGSPVALRAVVDRADVLLDVGGQAVERTSLLFTVRTADVPEQPRRGDRFEYVGRVWQVGEPASFEVEAAAWTARADRLAER
jgi:hypothetical protein